MVARSILATEQDLIANGLGLGQGQGHDEDADDHTAPSHIPSQTPSQTTGLVVPVSAATGAGVQRLWLRLLHQARLSTLDAPSQNDNAPSQIPSQMNPFAVREHRNAALLRKQDYLRQLSRFRKAERVG